MMIEVIDTHCPNCKSENRETTAFGRDIFRYKCSDCNCTYEIMYERVPTKVSVFVQKIHEPMTVEKFLQEYECNWIE